MGDADLEAELLDPALKPPRLDRGIVAELEESSAAVVVGAPLESRCQATSKME
jgi:hypothetical protein